MQIGRPGRRPLHMTQVRLHSPCNRLEPTRWRFSWSACTVARICFVLILLLLLSMLSISYNKTGGYQADPISVNYSYRIHKDMMVYET